LADNVRAVAFEDSSIVFPHVGHPHAANKDLTELCFLIY